MNFSILYPGRMSNQLVLLYHIYNTYEVDKIYAPNFEYEEYFNIEKLCDKSFYENNIENFTEVKWGEETMTKILDYYDPKFNDLKLKKEHNDTVQNILKNFNEYENLISVHVRHTDFKNWHNGLYYFEYEEYMKKCYEKIDEWGLTNFKILIFSDSKQNVTDSNCIFISSLTNFIPPIDLFIMSNCNYFISTWSTFTIISKGMSFGLNKYKNDCILGK